MLYLKRLVFAWTPVRMRRTRRAAPVLIYPTTKYHRRLMRSVRPPLWRRMCRLPALVVFALALPILLYGLVGPDPLAHDVTPHPDVTWDGDPDHGTVKVSKTQSGDGVDRISFTIREGQSVSYYFKATHPPGGTNWYIRIMVDGQHRMAGSYNGIAWSLPIGRSLNASDYDDWKHVAITATQDDINRGTRTITFDHEVWGNNGDCPIHEVGTVVVTVIDDDGSSPPPPPLPPPPPPGTTTTTNSAPATRASTTTAAATTTASTTKATTASALATVTATTTRTAAETATAAAPGMATATTAAGTAETAALAMETAMAVATVTVTPATG